MTNEQAERLVLAVERVVSTMEEMREEQRSFQKLAGGAQENGPEQIIKMLTDVLGKSKKGEPILKKGCGNGS